MSNRKPKDENFNHDSYVMYTSWGKQIRRLDGDQTKKLITMILDYAETDTYEESEDLAVDVLFDTIKRELDINWENYAENKKKNRLNTLIRCIKQKQEITPDTIEFIKTIPAETRKYLKEHGISDAEIDKLLSTDKYR